MNNNNIFSKDIAIDVGSCYTRIIVEGEGISIYEPTVLAKDINTGKVVAIGKEAKEMEGKTPPCIEIIKPVSEGVISDFEDTAILLREFLLKACQMSVIKPRVIITVPCCITEVEKNAMMDAVTLAGARKTYILDSTIGAAAGANCDISLPRGMLVAHIGGGRTDISAISVGNTVISHTIKLAGNKFTEETIKYIKAKYDLNIGWLTAEKLKEDIGCVYTLDSIQSRKVYGMDVTMGIPKYITVSSEELRDAYEETLQSIIQEIKSTLEDTPPELLGDILEDGILLTGGGAALYGIDRRIRMSLGIKVFLAQNPDLCAVMGAGAELSKLNAKTMPIRNVGSAGINI